MASLKEICRRYNGDIQDGCAWVAVWKNGRSWNACAFYPENGTYDDGYEFLTEDAEQMESILKEDYNAIIINGYYTNCGTDENKSVSVTEIVAGIEWNYFNRFNQLSSFVEGWVIK